MPITERNVTGVVYPSGKISSCRKENCHWVSCGVLWCPAVSCGFQTYRLCAVLYKDINRPWARKTLREFLPPSASGPPEAASCIEPFHLFVCLSPNCKNAIFLKTKQLRASYGVFKESIIGPMIGPLKYKMAEIRHLENRHYVIFFCWVRSDLDKISQTGAELQVTFAGINTTSRANSFLRFIRKNVNSNPG